MVRPRKLRTLSYLTVPYQRVFRRQEQRPSPFLAREASEVNEKLKSVERRATFVREVRGEERNREDIYNDWIRGNVG